MQSNSNQAKVGCAIFPLHSHIFYFAQLIRVCHEQNYSAMESWFCVRVFRKWKNSKEINGGPGRASIGPTLRVEMMKFSVY
jgi:hypothetical protein